jgi:hypothetical protein
MARNEENNKRTMRIALTVSPENGITEADVMAYIAVADQGWDVSFSGADGITREFELTLSFVASGGDITIRPCTPAVCTTGLGAASAGGNKIWHSSNQRPTTPTHEFGHIFGFAANRGNGTGSIMGGDRNRAVNQRDFDLLWDAYKYEN